MPNKDTKQLNSGKLIDNPLIKRIIYQLPHGKEGYQVLQFIDGQADKHQEVVDHAKATARRILDDFKHRQRKDARATHIIEGLEDLLVGVDTQPKVGDLVVITPEGNHYEHSKEGSYGILKGIGPKKSDIEFHYVTGEKRTLPATFAINNGQFKKAVLATEVERPLELEVEETVTTGLKVNDKVQICEDSDYFGQHDGEGQIIAIDPFNVELPFVVKFRDGEQNQYSIDDLALVRNTKLKAVKNRPAGKYAIKDQKVHDKACVHRGLAGKVCHYISRVSADHIVGSVITAVAIYVGQWAMEHYQIKAKIADLFSQSRPAETSLYEANKPVMQPTILVSGETTEKTTVVEPTETPQMPDAETMRRMFRVY